MDDGDEFMNFVSRNFTRIKNDFKSKIKRMGLSFNEDIFSDTILKCNDRIKQLKPDRMDMIAYLWTAFKMNTLRELSYARNNTIDEIPEISTEDFDTTNDMFNDVSELIINKFGEEIYELFLLHSNGVKYDDLERMTTLRHLKYLFRRVREYVRLNYR